MAWLVGYPRDKIDWYPAIDSEKCVQCGVCMNCGKKVYDWTDKGAVVARPYQCVVGCSTCANLCQGEAISFPNIEGIREIYRRERIWKKIKKHLTAQGKLEVKERQQNNGE
ncbi:ferredoxin family protein [candidate division TA06 bacterium]|uniref:Ferredoxin family protein n=1 Tax=candidate division TA06 bacterium TaxID=2250710 RepID=A0A523UTZ1_UNCT6|nr:MAG: ferredoxin family protein [candidate division TA06 bacterium]